MMNKNAFSRGEDRPNAIYNNATLPQDYTCTTGGDRLIIDKSRKRKKRATDPDSIQDTPKYCHMRAGVPQQPSNPFPADGFHPPTYFPGDQKGNGDPAGVNGGPVYGLPGLTPSNSTSNSTSGTTSVHTSTHPSRSTVLEPSTSHTSSPSHETSTTARPTSTLVIVHAPPPSPSAAPSPNLPPTPTPNCGATFGTYMTNGVVTKTSVPRASVPAINSAMNSFCQVKSTVSLSSQGAMYTATPIKYDLPNGPKKHNAYYQFAAIWDPSPACAKLPDHVNPIMAPIVPPGPSFYCQEYLGQVINGCDVNPAKPGDSPPDKWGGTLSTECIIWGFQAWVVPVVKSSGGGSGCKTKRCIARREAERFDVELDKNNHLRGLGGGGGPLDIHGWG